MALTVKITQLLVVAALLVGVVNANEDWNEHEIAEVEVMMNNRTHDYNVSVVGEGWGNDYLSGRFGMGVLGVRRARGIYGAAFGGIRLSVPYYVSPFVGAAVMIGRGWDRGSESRYDRDQSQSTQPRSNDNQDRGPYGYIVACYPEAGVRLWLGQHASLSGTVRYFVSSNGRSNDCFLYGGGLNVRF